MDINGSPTHPSDDLNENTQNVDTVYWGAELSCYSVWSGVKGRSRERGVSILEVKC